MQKFNYHSHTYRCGHADLDMKDEDYIKEYIKMGFEKIAFTDHCPEKNEILRWNELIELANEIIGKETIKKLSFIERRL